tara:strand:- start:4333 stop:4563 length:231 start_codon:yes stop_codon:yes gene_type:complete
MDKELQLAMDNAYQVIVEFATIDEIALSKPKEPLYLAFDPDKMEKNEYWDEVISSMIDYFILQEEYEKCAKLKELL